MITQREYERVTLDGWRKARLRTRVRMSNSLASLPPGTFVRVIDKRSGFTIQTERCATCGVQIRIARVPPDELEHAE